MEDYDDYLKEYYEYLKEERSKFEKALEVYKDNCIVPFEDIEELDVMNFEDGDFYHTGYCTVSKREYKNEQKPKREIFEIKDFEGDVKEDFKFILFEKQWETEGFYILLFQTVGCCGDDYSGYILFPMKDGRYWIVNFSNI